MALSLFFFRKFFVSVHCFLLSKRCVFFPKELPRPQGHSVPRLERRHDTPRHIEDDPRGWVKNPGETLVLHHSTIQPLAYSNNLYSPPNLTYLNVWCCIIQISLLWMKSPSNHHVASCTSMLKRTARMSAWNMASWSDVLKEEEIWCCKTKRFEICHVALEPPKKGN